MRATGWLLTAAILTTPISAQAQSRPDQKAFFGLYKELVETNTTLSAGSCTQAAAQIGARLKSAGYADAAGADDPGSTLDEAGMTPDLRRRERRLFTFTVALPAPPS